MIVAAEELFRGDLVHLKTSGLRAAQPEHEDIYLVEGVQDHDTLHVMVFLLEMWDETPALVPVLRCEKVEIIRVYS